MFAKIKEKWQLYRSGKMTKSEYMMYVNIIGIIGSLIIIGVYYW